MSLKLVCVPFDSYILKSESAANMEEVRTEGKKKKQRKNRKEIY
jgi:hypothetical protein